MSDQLQKAINEIGMTANQGRALAIALSSDTTIQEMHRDDFIACILALKTKFEQIENMSENADRTWMQHVNISPAAAATRELPKHKQPLAILTNDYALASIPFFEMAEAELKKIESTDTDNLEFLFKSYRKQHKEFINTAYDLYDGNRFYEDTSNQEGQK